MMKCGFVVCFAVLVCIGCGGGGGAAGGGASALISGDNAAAVASDVYQALDATSNSVGQVFVKPGDAHGTTQRLHVAAFCRKILADLQSGAIRPARYLPNALTQSESVDCDSGSLSGTWNDADDDGELSVGDEVWLTASGCYDSYWGVLLNGSIYLGVSGSLGDPDFPPWDVSAYFAFDEFTATDGIDTVSIDGSLSVSVSTQDNVAYVLGLSIQTLSVMVSGVGSATVNTSLQLVYDDGTGSWRLSGSGWVNSSAAGGTVSFSIDPPFYAPGGGYPSSGVLTIVGGGGTKLTVTAQSSTTVRVDADTDGDGVMDWSRTYAWSSFL